MQSAADGNGLRRQSSQDGGLLDNSPRKKGHLWYRRSMKGHTDREWQNAATLPRGWKQTKQTRSHSLVDYADPQRTAVVLEKQDDESFGFEIQTYGLQQKSSSAVEMCTFVCRVQEDSAAESAGLSAGDVIVTINGASIEGSSHRHIIGLIQESTNVLKMETVCGTIVKRIELEKKMSLLKQTLREKWAELQALTLQEERLTRGNSTDSSLHLSIDSLVFLDRPTGRGGRRFNSDSSCRSMMTDDSDPAGAFEDLCSPRSCSSAGSTTDDGCFFSSRDFPPHEGSGRSSSGPSHHHSSSLLDSSSSLSPNREATRASSLFGTLPRKGKRANVRKHILKLLPSFHRSVDEEELGPNA